LDAVCNITTVQVESVRNVLEGSQGYIVPCTDFLVCHGVLAIIECTHTDRRTGKRTCIRSHTQENTAHFTEVVP